MGLEYLCKVSVIVDFDIQQWESLNLSARISAGDAGIGAVLSSTSERFAWWAKVCEIPEDTIIRLNGVGETASYSDKRSARIEFDLVGEVKVIREWVDKAATPVAGRPYAIEYVDYSISAGV